MDLGLNNKRVLVTGGTRGIGRAVAELFLEEGAKVWITGSHQREGWWDAKKGCSFMAHDFRDPDQVEALLKRVQKFEPQVLINNAACFDNIRIEDTDFVRWTELLYVNLSLPMMLIKAASASMREANWGRIVNVGSIAGLISRPGLSAYSSSKAGLLGLTRTAALELAKYEILVNCVCPAYTDTDMLKSLSNEDRNLLHAKIPLRRFATPEDISRNIVFLASEANRFTTGQALVVDGGVTIQ